jgi:hypothetical protein
MEEEILFLYLTGFKNLSGIKKDCNVQQETAPKKMLFQKNVNVIVKWERISRSYLFRRGEQNVAPSLRLKGC